LLGAITFLTPAAAVLAAAAVAPLVAVLAAASRVARVRRALQLPPPRARLDLTALASMVLAIALLALAAAQPVLTHRVRRTVRTDVQALFVLDNSRSMAASTSVESPTRLDRAIGAAENLRAAIPQVEAGVATITDRVLPDLLPVADPNSFDSTLRRSVGIEQPPPQAASVTATTYQALTNVVSGNFFEPHARRRVVVLLSDGESRPYDVTAVARSLGRAPGVDLVTVRLSKGNESIFDADGRREPAYHADPTGQATLRELADATGGKAFDESQLGAARSALRDLVGSGPTKSTSAVERQATPLAPYLALASLAPLALLFARRLRLPARRRGPAPARDG
jgi:hypothetical protein